MRPPPNPYPKQRLGYLDWMRGLAAAIMLQGHVLEGWLRTEDRGGTAFWLSQFAGGLPAPIFLFLVGTSLALVLDKLRVKDAPFRDMLAKVLRRSIWILAIAYAFRIEQYLAWYPDSRWSDVFRMDTLNCIGACTLVAGLMSLPFRNRRVNAYVVAGAAALVVLLTPFLYVWRVSPSAFIQSYFNGDGNPSYFSIVPWIAFSLAGVAFGFLLNDARERKTEKQFFYRAAVAGVGAYTVGFALNLTRVFDYGFFDYSLTSPHFFLVRLGYLLFILAAGYFWSLRPTASRWSPLRTLGQASLLVYWLHIEIVYGRPLSPLGLNRALTVHQAALQLVWIIPAMIIVAWLRTNWKAVRLYLSTRDSRSSLRVVPDEL